MYEKSRGTAAPETAKTESQDLLRQIKELEALNKKLSERLEQWCRDQGPMDKAMPKCVQDSEVVSSPKLGAFE